MVKKKNKDFQKVRIKVGRKLKRQNETVVNLTTRKIILPKDRTSFKESSDNQSELSRVDCIIQNLNIEKHFVQSSALKSLIKIFEPFTRQIMTLPLLMPGSNFNVPSKCLIQLVDVYQKLFSCDSSCLHIQMGDLMHVFLRLCRSVQDFRISEDMCQLLLHTMKIYAFHPKLPDFINLLDQIALSLFQRFESHWKNVGCQVAGHALNLHCQFISSLSICIQQSGSVVFDSFGFSDQWLRFGNYIKHIIQNYANLKQMRSLKSLTNLRAELIRTTLDYLKDQQYTCGLMRRVTSSSYSLANVCGHPWLRSPPLFLSHSNTDQHIYLPINGYYLKTFSTAPGMKSSMLDTSVSTQLMMNRTPKNDWDGTAKRKASDSFKAHVDGEDYVLASCLIDEGLILFEEFLSDPSESRCQSVVNLLRALRILFESNLSIFSRQTSGGGRWSMDQMRNKSHQFANCLERFIHKLYVFYPIQIRNVGGSQIVVRHSNSLEENDDSSQTELMDFKPSISRFTRMNNHSNDEFKWHSSPSTDKVDTSLSRRQLKQQLKRKHKLARREDRRLERAEVINSQTPKSTHSSTLKTDQLQSAKLIQLVHQINYTAFELFSYMEAHHQSVLEHYSIWPPPSEMQQRLVGQLWFDELLNGSNGIQTSLVNLTGWLRAFDIYLVGPYRHKWNIVSLKNRLFSAPIVALLGQLSHRIFANRLANSKLLTRGQHRLAGRCVGLMTHFLTMELVNQMPRDHDVRILSYDEDWIRNKLTLLKVSLSDESFIFDKMVHYLVEMAIEKVEPPRMWTAAPLHPSTQATLSSVYGQLNFTATKLVPVQVVDNTWTACLLQLYEMRFAPCIRLVEDNAIHRSFFEVLFANTYKYSDTLVPLKQLKTQFDIQSNVMDDSEDLTFSDLVGWLTQGYLPSINGGLYASPIFWRPVKESKTNY